jgi:hypothetical protein
MNLIFINKIGMNHKGEFSYEFLFSNSIDWDWDESWYVPTIDVYSLIPDVDWISNVGSLTTDELNLELVQELGTFSVFNSVEGIIALGWEKFDEEDSEKERLVFQFGESIDSVKDKLYSRDLIFNNDTKMKVK